jgi:hypothetical protein
MTQLKRRGFSLGNAPGDQKISNNLDSWKEGYPTLLKAECLNSLQEHCSNIKQTEELVRAVLEVQDYDSVLAKTPYVERLEPKFQSLGSVFNEGDQQEIEMVMFDAMDGEKIIAEDLWLKASWLSFHEDDDSLRFRFSFGIDLEQDVASDPYRQQLSAELTDAVFPESKIITGNIELEQKLKQILNCNGVSFVERIIYFNAPNGGAYLHHDLERGHAGVVFAQLTGQTFWLALPKEKLVQEIISFAKTHSWPDSLTLDMKNEINELIGKPPELAKQLGSFANSSLIHLINETKEFVQFLIAKGHSTKLEEGDVLLLPQESEETCCWHSVFCLGEEMGQALSFAIRAKA